MVKLKFFTYDLQGNSHQIENILSFELSKSINAPCDGLRLTYISDACEDEIKTVEVFDENKKIFKGFCDTQQETVSSNGVLNFIYARSSICVLVDNQAQPCIYQSPSAASLFIKNAQPFGFKNTLPDIYCSSLYQVPSGGSCYTAINNFVNGITGKRVMADACDNLFLPNERNSIELNGYSIINEKRIINRGQALTAIDYKINGSDDYIYHCKSRFADSQGIRTSKKVNLSSLPEWQRKYTLSNMLKSKNSSYYSVELILDGFDDFMLYDAVEYKSNYFGFMKDYYISSVCSMFDSKGERTKLTLSKNIDVKEINYVD